MMASRWSWRWWGRRWAVSSFFFQAEDGIRDGRVTGVQTCALPISRRYAGAGRRRLPTRGGRMRRAAGRSEERRVGKECRSRWSPYYQKKKVLEEMRLIAVFDLI